MPPARISSRIGQVARQAGGPLAARRSTDAQKGVAIKSLAGIIKRRARGRPISRRHPSRAPRFGSCAMKYATLAFAFLLGFALLIYAQPWG